MPFRTAECSAPITSSRSSRNNPSLTVERICCVSRCATVTACSSLPRLRTTCSSSAARSMTPVSSDRPWNHMRRVTSRSTVATAAASFASDAAAGSSLRAWMLRPSTSATNAKKSVSAVASVRKRLDLMAIIGCLSLLASATLATHLKEASAVESRRSRAIVPQQKLHD